MIFASDVASSCFTLSLLLIHTCQPETQLVISKKVMQLLWIGHALGPGFVFSYLVSIVCAFPPCTKREMSVLLGFQTLHNQQSHTRELLDAFETGE